MNTKTEHITPDGLLRFVIECDNADLLGDRSVIAISRVGDDVQDVWITHDPASELSVTSDTERIELRSWSGKPWQPN